MPASQVFSSSGDPNGVVDGNPGDVCQDQTGKLWLNIAAPSTWIQLPGGDLGWFGTGVDGDHTVIGTETLLRDKFYRNLTIPAGTALRTAGFRVYVSGTLTIAPGAVLHNSGQDGQNGADAIPGFSNALGGAGAPTTNMLGGGDGGNGGFDDEDGDPGHSTADYPANEPIKNGGKGGDGTSGVGGAGGSTTPQFGFGTYMISTMAVGSFVSGGPGGGGGAGNDNGGDVGFGGGAGGGGGVIMISAKHIDAAPGTIQARGGKGGDGASDGAGGGIGGGGGGGVGGTIIIVTNDRIAPPVDFSGGAGGVGFNGGANGAVGDGGALIAISPAWGPL